MADFDAGSIEGRLDLDTSAFTRGLQQAKAQAKEFEATGSTTAHSGVDVDSGDAEAKIAAVEARLKKIDHEKATAEVRVDNSQASAALSALERHVDRVAGVYKSSSPGAPGGGHGMAYLIGLAAALAPALGPATGAIGLFGAAAVAAFGGAAVSMGLWGAVAKGVFGQIEKADKAGKTLTGTMGQMQSALKGLSGAWSDLQTKAAPGLAKALLPTFQTLEHLIPRLLPLINAVSTGVGGALLPIDNLLKSKRMDHFIDLLSSNAVQDLPQVGTALAHILSGLMGTFTALNPLIQLGLPAIVKITKEFDHWSHTGAGDYVNKIFDQIRTYGPLTLNMLHSLFGALGNVVKGLTPLVGPALHFLTLLFNAIKNLDLTPLTKGIGDVLDKLGPFLTIIGELVNVLLPPLGTLLSTLADSFIGPLGDSLATVLVPAFGDLSDILNTLAPFLGQFIASIADLVNPTGVGLLVSLIGGLTPIIKELIPPVAHLVLALEGAVDTFLKAVGPAVIPALVVMLHGLSKALIPVINGLAWFLSHKSVAITILGIYTAVKLVSGAMKVWAAITKGLAFISAVFDGIAAAMVGITLAEDANTGAIAANKIALIAWRGIMLAVRGATILWSAAMKVLNLLFIDNPIGLVVVAVAALVVGIIYAYKHSSTFRDIVHDLWDVLKATGEWIGNVAVAIWHALGDAIGWVKHHAELLLLLLGPFGIAIIAVVEAIKHWHQILGIAKGVWSDVLAFFRGLGAKVKAVFSAAGDWLNDAGHAVLHGLLTGIKWYWEHSLYGWLYGMRFKIFDAVGDLAHSLYDKGVALIQGFWNGISDRFDKLWKDFGGKIKSLTSWLPGSPAKVGPLSGKGWTLYRGRAMIDAFAQGITDGMGGAEGAMHDAMAAVTAAMQGGVDSVVGKVTIDVATTGPGYAADLQAQAQAESMRQLVEALGGLGDDFKSMTKEERDAMTEALSKSFTAAGVAQTKTILTAAKKQ